MLVHVATVPNQSFLERVVDGNSEGQDTLEVATRTLTDNPCVDASLDRRRSEGSISQG